METNQVTMTYWDRVKLKLFVVSAVLLGILVGGGPMFSFYVVMGLCACDLFCTAFEVKNSYQVGLYVVVNIYLLLVIGIRFYIV